MAFNKYQYEKLRAKRHATKVKHKAEIYEIRHSNDPERKKPAYGKLLVGLLFIDAFFIQCFILRMIYITKDMSQIGSLIGLIGTLFVQVISLASYNKKSQAENTVGGIVYQNMMNSLEHNNMENDISEDIADDGAVG